MARYARKDLWGENPGQCRSGGRNSELNSGRSPGGQKISSSHLPGGGFRSWLGSPDLFLMDVRSAEGWDRSIAKIEPSHRSDPEKLAKMSRDLPKSKKLVLYCENGETSCPGIARELEKMGFANLYILEAAFGPGRGKNTLWCPRNSEPLAGGVQKIIGSRDLQGGVLKIFLCRALLPGKPGFQPRAARHRFSF